ncbi:MAG: hypothetical protein ACU84Q_17515 [Gammaproteobacteria bacterium]
MVRKNRLMVSIARYFVVGTILGAIVGLLLNMLLVSAPSGRLEARVLLFRIPSDDTYQAARDYLSLAISRPGFLDDFAKQQGLDSGEQALLARNLSVVARDASSPNAQLRLVGDNEAALSETLNALAIYVTEALRTIDETAMQSLLNGIEKEIEKASEKNLALLNARDKFNPLPDDLNDSIRLSTALVTKRKELEISLRYTLKPLSKSDEGTIREQLDKIIEQQQGGKRPIRVAARDIENFDFARELAHSSAILRVLRQAKQNLVIAYNGDTPLRIAGRAAVTPLTLEATPTGQFIAICAFLGALIGGFIWSMLRSRSWQLTGLNIERRLGVPTLAVIAQKLTDCGTQLGGPLAHFNSDSNDLACIKSLSIALSLLQSEQGQNAPLIFSEVGGGDHIAHVTANLAIVMAAGGDRVLVISATGNEEQSKDLFRHGEEQGWCATLTAQDLTNNHSAQTKFEPGKICYYRVKDETIPLADLAQFNKVLILARHPADAKKQLTHHACGVGVVLCTTGTRVSILRRALGRKMHGVVLCGHPS